MKQDRKKNHSANASYLFVWTVNTDSSSQRSDDENQHSEKQNQDSTWDDQGDTSRLRDRRLENNGDEKDPDQESPNPHPRREEMPVEDPLDNPEVEDPDYPEREEIPSPDDIERGDSPDERGILPDEEDEGVTN